MSEPTDEQIIVVSTLLPNDAETFGWDANKIADILTQEQLSNSRTVRRFWLDRVNNTHRYSDVSESTSTRPLSQIHAHAKAMLRYWDDVVASEPESKVTTISFGEIERPSR